MAIVRKDANTSPSRSHRGPGARDAHTTGLEVWTASDQLIRKVRVSFVGTPDGHQLTATATTEFYDLGADVVAEDHS
jgi:hypothetical protein